MADAEQSQEASAIEADNWLFDPPRWVQMATAGLLIGIFGTHLAAEAGVWAAVSTLGGAGLGYAVYRWLP